MAEQLPGIELGRQRDTGFLYRYRGNTVYAYTSSGVLVFSLPANHALDYWSSHEDTKPLATKLADAMKGSEHEQH